VVLAVALMVGGAVALTLGSEAIVRAGTRLAASRGVSTLVLGSILLGLDLGPVIVAAVAAGRDQTALAAGDAFGGMVFLMAATCGVALLLGPRPAEAPGPQLLLVPGGALVATALSLADQFVNRAEGFALLGLYALFVAVLLREGRAAQPVVAQLDRQVERGGRVHPGGGLAIGLVVAVGGAFVLVSGAVRLLERSTLAPGFVGAAIVGGLAASRELLASVRPQRAWGPDTTPEHGLAALGVLGLGALGLAAVIRPLDVDGAAGTAFIAASVLYTVAATAFLLRRRAGRVVGAVIVAATAAWILLAARV
jgi:cation:H+ antiporter